VTTSERIDNWVATLAPGILQPHWRRFRASPLSVRLARGVFWSLIGAVIARSLGVISSIIVARIVGITAYGEFTVIQSTVGLFGTFAGLGLGITATKYVAELRETDRVRCGRIIGLILTVATAGGLIAGVALVCFAPWMATHTLGAPKLAPLLQYGSALVLLNTLQGVYSGVLGGFENFKRVAQVNWMGAVFGTPFLVVFTFFGGLPGAVWGSVLQIAVGCVLGHVAVRQEAAKAGVKLSYKLHTGDLAILWHFSLPAFMSSTLAGPANWICNTFLANQPGGYAEVALLNAAGQWKNFLTFLPLMMTSVLVPIFASLYHTGQVGQMKKMLRRNLVINVGICFLLAAPLAVFAPFILSWFGPGFSRGVPVLLLTLVTTVLSAAVNLISRAMQATSQAWLECICSGLWAGSLVAGCLLFVPAHKAVGLASAHVFAMLLLVIVQWLLFRRLFKKAGAPPT
jgi:O-antigen/teichoic acid export membrane protein